MLKTFRIIRDKYRDFCEKARARRLLREYYRKSFATVCLYIKTRYIALDSIDVYIEHAPSFIAVIEMYKRKVAEQEKLKQYQQNKQLFGEKPLASDFLDKAREILLMLEEEKSEVLRTPALMPHDVVLKNNKITKLDVHIANTKATIEAQEELLEKIMPPKRKPGRPKGSKGGKK